MPIAIYLIVYVCPVWLCVPVYACTTFLELRRWRRRCRWNETKIIPWIISHVMIHTCIDVTFTFAIGTSVSHALPYNHLPMLCQKKLSHAPCTRIAYRIYQSIAWEWEWNDDEKIKKEKEKKSESVSRNFDLVSFHTRYNDCCNSMLSLVPFCLHLPWLMYRVLRIGGRYERRLSYLSRMELKKYANLIQAIKPFFVSREKYFQSKRTTKILGTILNRRSEFIWIATFVLWSSDSNERNWRPAIQQRDQKFGI